MHLRVIAADYPPYVNVRGHEEGEISIDGPAVELFFLLASHLNFTYSLQLPPDGQWGSKSKNGSWSGMIGMLTREEADMAIGPFTLTYDRFKAVQTTIPFFADTERILVKEEERTLSIFNFIGVFTWEVWMYLLVSTFLVTLIMTVADVIELSRKNMTFAFFQNLWDNSRAFFNQELGSDTPGRGKKILKIFWTLSIMILSVAFGANFLSTLLVPVSPRINSLEDLVAETRIQPIIEKGSSVSSTLGSSSVPAYQAIFRRVMKNEKQLLLTLAEMQFVGLDFVRQGPYAIITDTTVLKSFLSERFHAGLPCNYHLSKEGFLQLWKVMAFSRTFPRKHLNVINEIILHTTESYWFPPQMEKEYTNYVRCTESGQGDFPSLKLTDMEGVFLVYVLGMSTSFIAFTSEILISRATKQKHNTDAAHHHFQPKRRRA